MPPTQPLKLHMCECGDLHLRYRSVTLHFGRAESCTSLYRWVVWLQTFHVCLSFDKRRLSQTQKVSFFIEVRDTP